jgi:acyl carrier protein
MDKISDLIGFIAKNLDVPEENIKPESKFKDDLGADSLDLVEMAMVLETRYMVIVTDEVAEKFITVQDVIDYLVKEGKIEQG